MARLDHGGADVLFGAGEAGVHGVDVEVVAGDHVTRRDRALVEVDVLAIVDDAARVIEIDEQRFAVAAGFRLDDVDGRTGGAEIDLVARGLHVMLGVPRVQHEVAGAGCQRILDEGARDAQPAVLVDPAALRRHRVDAGRDGLGEAYGFKQLEGGLVDALHLVVGERLVLAALHAGAHGGIRHGNGARTHRLAGFAATAAAGKVFDSTHGFRLLIWVLYPPVRCGDSMAYLFPGSVSFFHH